MHIAAIDRPDLLDEPSLRALLLSGYERARARGQPVLVSRVIPLPPTDPLAFYARAAVASRIRLFWSSPHGEQALVGVGQAWALAVGGPRRFTRAAAVWQARVDGAVVEGPTDAPATGPLLLGGFAFDPRRPSTGAWAGFPDGLLTLPRFLLTATPGAAWLTLNAVMRPDRPIEVEARALRRLRAVLAAPDAAPRAPDPPGPLTLLDCCPSTEWMAIVRSAVDRIRRGEFEKVVLALSRRVRAAAPFRPARILARLRADYPSCYLFAFGRADRCFLGASPEQLVRLAGGIVHTVCLAGSIGRGATPEEDVRLGESLLASPKNRAEHAIVVRGIRSLLTAAGVTLDPPGPPALLKLPTIQHLLTPIAGRLDAPRSILELVEFLHPTPSVGGQPRAMALRFIRDYEGLDRGWYAGPVGWLDARGEGEFAVAIRSALLHGREATLFAGCGIVADSDAELEYAEVGLKLRPLLAALEGSTR